MSLLLSVKSLLRLTKYPNSDAGKVLSTTEDGTLVLVNVPGTIEALTFTQEDLESDGADGWYLPLNLTGTQITAAVKSTAGFYKSGGDVESVTGFLSNEAQSITVFVLGEPAEFVSAIAISNNSDFNVTIHVGDGVGTILPGESGSYPLPPGLSVNLDVVSGQTCVYTVYNSIGEVVFTFTQIGTGTINGLPMTSDQRQEFIISNTLP